MGSNAPQQNPVFDEVESASPKDGGGEFVLDGARRDLLTRSFAIFVAQTVITLLAAYSFPWVSLDHDFYGLLSFGSLIFFFAFVFGTRLEWNDRIRLSILLAFTVTNAASFTVLVHREFGFVMRMILTQALVCLVIIRWARTASVDLTGRKILLTAILIDFFLEFFAIPMFPLWISAKLVQIEQIVMCSIFMTIVIQTLMGGREYELNTDEPLIGALLLHSAFFATFGYTAVWCIMVGVGPIFEHNKSSTDSSDQSNDRGSEAVSPGAASNAVTEKAAP